MKKTNFYLFFLTLSATIAIHSQAIAFNNNSMSGFKLGLSGGYTSTKSNKTTDLVNLNLDPYSYEQSNQYRAKNTPSDAGNIGFNLGYGHTFQNKLHIGAMYDFSIVEQRMKINNFTAFPLSHPSNLNKGISNQMKAEEVEDKGKFFLHSFSAIIGHEFNINQNHLIMPFVKAGYTLSHHSGFDTFSKLQGQNSLGHGFNVGAGVVYSPHKNFYASLEYTYVNVYYNNNTNVEHHEYNGDNAKAYNAAGLAGFKRDYFINTNSNFGFHNVKATIGVKFNVGTFSFDVS